MTDPPSGSRRRCRICGEALGVPGTPEAPADDGAELCPFDLAIRQEARRRVRAAREAGLESDGRDRLLSTL